MSRLSRSLLEWLVLTVVIFVTDFLIAAALRGALIDYEETP